MSSCALPASTLVGSAIVAFILTPIVAAVAKYAGVVDEPGGRKFHRDRVPLGGGVAALLSLVLGGIACGYAFGPGRLLHVLGSEHHIGILAPALLIFLVGLADDIRGVSPAVKVAVQAMGAAIAIDSGLVLDSLWTPWGPVAFRPRRLAWVPVLPAHGLAREGNSRVPPSAEDGPDQQGAGRRPAETRDLAEGRGARADGVGPSPTARGPSRASAVPCTSRGGR